MVGYIVFGAAYGILMKVNGFGFWWVLASSVIIYAGSLQYLEVTLLAGLVNPIYAFLMGLMINVRHLFYGISMLSKYGGLKKWKTYLIYTLTDETFSVVVVAILQWWKENSLLSIGAGTILYMVLVQVIFI